MDAAFIHADTIRVLSKISDCWIHFDPDRRPGERRTQQGELFSPPLDTLCDIAERARGAAIKVAPGTEFDDRSGKWKRLWIGRDRECPIQLLLFGQTIQPSFSGAHTAVLLQDTGLPLTFSSEPQPADETDVVEHRYVYELHPALYGAELSGAWSVAHGLESLGGSLGYYFSDQLVQSPWMQSFEILGIEAWDDRKVRAWLRKQNAGPLEVKKRLIQLDANLYQRKYSKPDGVPITCLVTRIGRSTRVIFARRLSSSADPATSA